MQARLEITDTRAQACIMRWWHMRHVVACEGQGRVFTLTLPYIPAAARRYGDGTIRLTVEQDVIFPNVPEASVDALRKEPIFGKYEIDPGNLTRGMVSCTGAQVRGLLGRCWHAAVASCARSKVGEGHRRLQTLSQGARLRASGLRRRSGRRPASTGGPPGCSSTVVDGRLLRVGSCALCCVSDVDAMHPCTHVAAGNTNRPGS